MRSTLKPWLPPAGKVWANLKMRRYTVFTVCGRCGPLSKHRGKGVRRLPVPCPRCTVYTSTVCAVARARTSYLCPRARLPLPSSRALCVRFLQQPQRPQQQYDASRSSGSSSSSGAAAAAVVQQQQQHLRSSSSTCGELPVQELPVRAACVYCACYCLSLIHI